MQAMGGVRPCRAWEVLGAVQAVQVMGGLLGAVQGMGGARPYGPYMPWEELGAVQAVHAMGGLLGAVQGMGGARGRAGRAGQTCFLGCSSKLSLTYGTLCSEFAARRLSNT